MDGNSRIVMAITPKASNPPNAIQAFLAVFSLRKVLFILLFIFVSFQAGTVPGSFVFSRRICGKFLDDFV
jgi:hypothetical protein